MSEMIERVAEAIGSVFSTNHDEIVGVAMAGDNVTDTMDSVLQACAIKAIIALRYPTSAMLLRGQAAPTLSEAWEEMLAEALEI